jgi:hypothetical protein
MTTTADYIRMQELSGFRVGDKVRVVRTAKKHELGWENTWVDEMDNTVGKIFTIIDDLGKYGFTLSTDIDGKNGPRLTYPFYCLTLVDKETNGVVFDPSYRPEPFQKVLCRDNDNDVWEPDIVRFYVNNGGRCYFNCLAALWEQCIPYEGNEHLAKKEI